MLPFLRIVLAYSVYYNKVYYIVEVKFLPIIVFLALCVLKSIIKIDNILQTRDLRHYHIENSQIARGDVLKQFVESSELGVVLNLNDMDNGIKLLLLSLSCVAPNVKQCFFSCNWQAEQSQLGVFMVQLTIVLSEEIGGYLI